MKNLDPIALALLAATAASVYLANLFITTVGACVAPGGPCLIPVGLGLMAPSGVVWVPVALLLRDALDERGGRRWVAAGVALGALLSAALSPALALASGAAFAASELADWAAYRGAKPRWGAPLAVLASGAVGIVVDSVAFLWLAGYGFDFLLGQIIGKGWGVLAGFALVWAAARVRRAEVAA